MSQIYYINSSLRSDGTHSNFSYTINLPLGSNFDRVSVLQASIPKSFYQIETGFQTFILGENGSEVNIVLPIGNYNRKTFASVLTSLLNSNSPNHWAYNITYPNNNITQDDGKYIFTVSNNTTQPYFIFNDFSPFEAVGFMPGIFTFNSSILKSVNVTKLYLQDNIIIHSDICQNFNDNVLQDIFTNDFTSFSNIVFQNTAPYAYSKKITTNNSNTYKFYLTDDSGNPIDLNGNNMLITILMYTSNR